MLASFAGSAQGRARVAALRPQEDVFSVAEALAATAEAVQLVERAGRQPYHDLPDVCEEVAAAEVEGLHLEPRALADVASFLEGAVGIAQSVRACEEVPRLLRLAGGVEDFADLTLPIRRAILPSGEVSDDASPRLAEMRRTLVRLRSQLHSVMEGYLHGKDAERMLQDKLVTTRNDRYVLLLKAEHRSLLPGIVHGASGSGASVFVEPLPAVGLNNDIVECSEEERREVVRVLRDLTSRVRLRAGAVRRAISALAELDLLQAKALLSREMGAHVPRIRDGAREPAENGAPLLELLQARHPLLISSLTERLGLPPRALREPVPVTLRLAAGEPVLVISGPNTGGKTVALKTMGLLALMAQSGLPIPAAPGSVLPVFRRVFADIGDDQSLAESLSTFSAHLQAIQQMAADLATPALVLLDEVGGGTDPTEGGALGVAVVDGFRRRGAMVVVTTHHGLLKAWAQSTPGVACASFGYDPRSYEPSYRLELGQPGRSLALEMAERLGLPRDWVEDARARRDTKQAQAEELLKILEQKEALLAREEQRVLGLRAEAEGALARARTAEREMLAKKQHEAESFARELRRRADAAAQQAQAAIQQAVARVEASRKAVLSVGAKAKSEALEAIQQAHAEVLADAALGLPAEPELPKGALAPGARVRTTMGIVGEVLSLHGDEIELAVSGKRLLVRRHAIAAVLGAAKPAGRVSIETAPSGEAVPAEINLIGLTVDEAIPRIDKLLDSAALSDRREIRIIHGFGAGRLRKAVASMLSGHPLVASYRQGAPNEGGGGATIVELKD
ncbi:MAG: endonuclease MutS2 [Vicinamibacteria bacterium]